jgi:hypothetical protein
MKSRANSSPLPVEEICRDGSGAPTAAWQAAILPAGTPRDKRASPSEGNGTGVGASTARIRFRRTSDVRRCRCCL